MKLAKSSSPRRFCSTKLAHIFCYNSLFLTICNYVGTGKRRAKTRLSRNFLKLDFGTEIALVPIRWGQPVSCNKTRPLETRKWADFRPNTHNSNLANSRIALIASFEFWADFGLKMAKFGQTRRLKLETRDFLLRNAKMGSKREFVSKNGPNYEFWPRICPKTAKFRVSGPLKLENRPNSASGAPNSL